MEYIGLETDIQQIPNNIKSDLEKKICSYLDKVGIFYRIFSRNKSGTSVREKFNKKDYNNVKKMQDLFGVRIALYFKDDIAICKKIIEKKFIIKELTADQERVDNFSPTRLNYVCELPDYLSRMINNTFWDMYPIDKTFEIQIRTIFSEGWHEVEHDFRYKCLSDWEDSDDFSRALNGIFATLETCDWSITSLFEQLAYRKYKSKCWESMVKNKLRIRFQPCLLSEDIISRLNENPQIGKEIIRLDRQNFLLFLSDENVINIPKTIDNIILSINELFIYDEYLHSITPTKLCDVICKYKSYNPS